ncbi:hypothetical protein [Micromonospora echinaurantiaca]|uniref:hypothetical protein n=1 Tax=Micromonospora echinaurantiaca TaxID=47857 RepID=UPI0015606FBC|nr:hypothetical protein [Micromonospora echinaurantiaca]
MGRQTILTISAGIDFPQRHPAPRSWPPSATAVGALRTTSITNIAAANRHHARASSRPLALLGLT